VLATCSVAMVARTHTTASVSSLPSTPKRCRCVRALNALTAVSFRNSKERMGYDMQHAARAMRRATARAVRHAVDTACCVQVDEPWYCARCLVEQRLMKKEGRTWESKHDLLRREKAKKQNAAARQEQRAAAGDGDLAHPRPHLRVWMRVLEWAAPARCLPVQ
jgi:hypothetical protein